MSSKVSDLFAHSATLARSALFDRRCAVAYVGGWLGKENLGDEALLVAYRLLFPDINFVPFDGGRASRQILKLLPGLRVGMLGGGTLIGQKPIWLEIPRTFLEHRKHLVIFGTGVEEPLFWKGEPTLYEWKKLIDGCPFVGVRGPRSAELLQDIGVSNVEIVGDPVLSFATTEINLNPIPNSVGLNIGTSDGKVWGNEIRIRDEIALLAKRAKEAKWRVEWYVVWPKDREITLAAANASGTAEHIYYIYEDHELYMRETHRLTAFIGMKLHATVLATCALTPSIMLEYRPKCRDYMESIGQGHVTFKTSDFKADNLWEIIKDWNGRRLEVARALARSIHARQASQRASAERLSSLIKSY